MVIEVVDTNVWVMMDNIPPDSESERTCTLACLTWGSTFSQGTEDYKIAVDMSFKILNEYFTNIKKGGLAEQYLRTILTKPMTRIEFVEIQLDDQGHAVLPEELAAFKDEDDRKSVAVSLKFEPPLPILNATDTDWVKEKTLLSKFNIEVKELCGDYIQEKAK